MANPTTTHAETDHHDGSPVALAKAGNEAAINQLARTYWPEAYRLALRILRSHEDAEDIAQDALWAAISHLPTFREDSSFRTWLYRIVLNRSLMALRRKHSRGVDSSLISIDDAPNCIKDTRTPEELLLETECRTVVAEGLSRLPAAYSGVLQLFTREGRSMDEIAACMGISAGAVKSRLHRGRAHLRRRISGHFSVSKGVRRSLPEVGSMLAAQC